MEQRCSVPDFCILSADELHKHLCSFGAKTDLTQTTPIMKIRKFLTLTAAFCAAFFLVLNPVSGGAGNEAVAAHVSAAVGSSKAFDYSKIPAWDGVPYYRLNQDVPYFTKTELANAAVSFKKFSPLDSRGRTGVSVASIGPDLLPAEKRGAIGMVKPSGWQTPQKKYDFISGKYVYNRCHQIAYSLSGENANPENLMTGTRYMNVDGMEPYELSVLGYVQKTGNHVLYRATPVFVGDELEARGILLEAQSIEDHGKGIRFNAFVYNVQPGVVIDYATGAVTEGESQADRSLAIENYASTVLYDEYGNTGAGYAASSGRAAPSVGAAVSGGTAASDSTVSKGSAAASAAAVTDASSAPADDSNELTYVVNTNTKKFHYPSCSSVSQIKQKNRLDTNASRDELISEGYAPCKRCNP